MSSKSSSYYGNGTDSILSKNDFLLRLIKYSVDGLAYTCAINFIFHDIEKIYQSTILLIQKYMASHNYALKLLNWRYKTVIR